MYTIQILANGRNLNVDRNSDIVAG